MAKNRDSMPTADRVSKAGKEGGKAGFIKPKGGSTEWYVTAEVNPINITHLLEKRAWFANTKTKATAQLVSEGAVPSFSSCKHAYMNSWINEANDNDLTRTFIQGKKKAKGRLWKKLIIVAEEPEGIAGVGDEVYNELSAQDRKSRVPALTCKG